MQSRALLRTIAEAVPLRQALTSLTRNTPRSFSGTGALSTAARGPELEQESLSSRLSGTTGSEQMAQAARAETGTLPGTAATDPLSNTIRAGVDKARAAAEKVGEMAMGVKEKVSEGMSSAAQSAEDAVDRGVQRAKDAGHAASGMAHEVGAQARDTASGTKSYLDESAEGLYKKAAKSAERLADQADQAAQDANLKGPAHTYEPLQEVVKDPKYQADVKEQAESSALGTRSGPGDSGF